MRIAGAVADAPERTAGSCRTEGRPARRRVGSSARSQANGGDAPGEGENAMRGRSTGDRRRERWPFPAVGWVFARVLYARREGRRELG